MPLPAVSEVSLPNISTLTRTSLVFGIIVLVSSSIVLEVTTQNLCYKRCSEIFKNSGQAMTAAMSLGIIGGLLQISFNSYVLIKGFTATRVWQIVHGVVCLIEIIAFSVGIHYNSEGVIWEILFCLDWIYCLIAVAISVFSGSGSTINTTTATATATIS